MPMTQIALEQFRQRILCCLCGEPVKAIAMQENFVDGGAVTAASCHGATEARTFTAADIDEVHRFGTLFFAPPDEDD